MDPTDERMVPESAWPSTVLEHLYRYRFAASYVRGLRVLDIASGEGYGSAGLAAAGAAKVLGVDIAPDACIHARGKYGLHAVAGSAVSIPLADASFDVVVSFETIEHLNDPAAFAREARRVLNQRGRFIVSTPNKLVFRRVADVNPFHHSEMTPQELHAHLSESFSEVKFFAQHPLSASWWSPRFIAAESSPLMRVRGFKRLHTILQTLAGTTPNQLLTDQARSKPEQFIAGNAGSGWRYANPYEVRPFKTRSGEEPLFIVAVATV